MALDMDKLNLFVGQFVGDLGAAVQSFPASRANPL
jgi:hypothetical protein